MSGAYYNEFDPFAAQWLRNLIAEGHIADGEVDERSIRDVEPVDLLGFDQCHFFAGIGGWSYALRLAGWPNDRPVWTGSCPCQPFSAAGQQKGEADERHLWPEFRRLIAECNPPIVFGEQVASKLGRGWLAGVRADLEALGFAVGAADLCAAGVGAPHIRQRLWWVADASASGRRALQRAGEADGRPQIQPDGHRDAVGLVLAVGEGLEGRPVIDGVIRAERQRATVERSGETGGLADTNCAGSFAGRQAAAPNGHGGAAVADGGIERMADAMRPGWTEGRAGTRIGSSAWSGGTFIPCADGKARRVGPGLFPLAHGVSARVGRLRGYGNAIVPQVAAEFILAAMP